MEVVRHNGLHAGVRYTRAQGHSRWDVDAECLLQELSVESLPAKLNLPTGHTGHCLSPFEIEALIPQCRLSKGEDHRSEEDERDANMFTS